MRTNPDLVVAVIPGDPEHEKVVSRAFADIHELEVLEDEPVTTPAGNPRPTTRRGGRPAKARKQLAPAGARAKKAVASANDTKEQDQ